jgi:alpha-tubulin suppressor-like RCC1 family protein
MNIEIRIPYEKNPQQKRRPLDTIAAGRRHTVSLKSDGTVMAVGDNKYGQCDVSGWRGIQIYSKKSSGDSI